MRVLSFLFLFIMLPLHSFGSITESQCSAKDFKKSFSPPRYQGNKGYCYAFAASDLLGEATGQKVSSAFYAAVRSIDFQNPKDYDAMCEIITENRDKPSFCFQKDPMKDVPLSIRTKRAEVSILERQGGYADAIMAKLIHQGYTCSESDIPSERGSKQYVGSTEHSYVEMDSDFLDRRFRALSQYSKIEKIEANAELMNTLNRSCPLNSPLPEFQQLLSTKAGLERWALKKIRSKHEMMCQSKIDIKDLKVRKFVKDGSADFSKKMMDVLDANRPFAVTYDIDNLLDDKFSEAPSLHSSVVTGRQWNSKTQTCQIEIKNSWGLDCPTKNHPEMCENGYLLVDIDKLSSVASDISWIDKRKSK